MLFDPSLIAATVYATGIVTTSPYTGGDGMGEFLNRAVVSHGRTFPNPPVVIPYEVAGNTRRLHFERESVFPEANRQALCCAGSVRVTNTGFELYSANANVWTGTTFPPPGTSWRYVTLTNTLANS